jgi:3-oxoadipate enol-lactonase
MPWLEANGVALRYELLGDGPETLLLLHEMGGSLESWDFVLPLLLPRFRVLRYDQRGAGLSEKPPRRLTMADAGRDAIGTEVGGAVALHLAATYRERVRAVIATSPATGVPEAAKQPLRDRADEIVREGLRVMVDPGLDQGYPPPLRGDAARFAMTRAQRHGASAEGQAATMRMLAGLDMEAELSGIRCPALILAGEHDLGRPPPRVAAVAEAIPGATFRVLPSGHFMAIQTPELLAAEVIGFLATGGSAS